jgi:hypothetical protein
MEHWNLPFPGPQKHAQLAPNSGTCHSGVQYFLSQLVRPGNCRNIPITLTERERGPNKKQLRDDAKIAHVEWAIGIFVVVMLGLYVWSHVTAGHRMGKKLQPFVDDLFGVTPSDKQESKTKPPAKPKANQ